MRERARLVLQLKTLSKNLPVLDPKAIPDYRNMIRLAVATIEAKPKHDINPDSVWNWIERHQPHPEDRGQYTEMSYQEYKWTEELLLAFQDAVFVEW